MTLSTSVNTQKIAIHYLYASLGTAVFAIIYEIFSHQVYSNYMIYAFLYPLTGLILYGICLLVPKITPCDLVRNLLACTILTLTLSSIFKGVLEIYGTTNSLTKYYDYAAIGLGILTLIFYLVQLFKPQSK